jgi:hypothetical protein
MIASAFVYRLALVVAACVTLGEVSRLHAQQAYLPEPIRLALLHYADLDPLAVTWTQTTELTPLGREKIDSNVLGRPLGEDPNVQQLAFRDGRIYMRRESKGSSSWPPRTEEIAFDRNLLYAANNLFYTGASGNKDAKDRPYLHKWLPKNDPPQACYFHDDYFRGAGVRLPARIKELVSSWRPQSELLALLAEDGRIQAVGPTNLEGRPLIRVQVTTHNLKERLQADVRKLLERFAPLERYDFYFDPERGYAVRRLEIRDQVDRLQTRCDCSEFEQLRGRLVWMPRLCRVEEYALAAATQDGYNLILDVSPSPLYVTKIQVNAFDVEPWPDDRFQLKNTTPGGYVNDASFPEMTGKDGVFYQVPANPERLDEVVAVRRAFYQAWRNAERRSRPLRVLFLILNGVALVSIAAYFFVRRRKKASST